MKYFNEAKNNFLVWEDNYSRYALRSDKAYRLKDIDDDIRTPFFRDIDRIIYSLSYSRYADKTQVYSYLENDHISRRMIHVQFVSKIARTIGRALRLNVDLIEAIALGHDIGHTPLGHFGEKILNEISIRELGVTFAHNVQSVRHYLEVDNGGEGLNLSIQVLDGIMCHNGEMLSNVYTPEEKSVEEFLEQYRLGSLDYHNISSVRPMTLEGCVVRISDVIAYIGRDLEDAVSLGKISWDDVPQSITKLLGKSNREIINVIVNDIIDNSLNHNYIALSEEVYEALNSLKEFNYKYIYDKSMSDNDKKYYREGINKIYNRYLQDIECNNKTSIIYTFFLNKKKEIYLNNTSSKRMVIDFISGMTDDLFLEEISK